MKELTREHVHFTFSANHPPADVIASGETVRFETYDCFFNRLLPEGASPSDLDYSKENAATGPLYIQGAEPGDMLKIEILEIQTGPVGFCYTGPGAAWDDGLIKEDRFRRFRVENDRIVWDDSFSMPITPMIGVIGTAPAEGEISNMCPGDHGGNMDCTRINAGSTLFLPVFVPGGLLSMGDLHAVMGDGEVCGFGLEIEGSVTVRVTVIKEDPLPWPAVLSGGRFMAVASAETTDKAWQLATARMEALLASRRHLSHSDSSMLLSLCADLAICQTVNPLKTVRMEIPEELLI